MLIMPDNDKYGNYVNNKGITIKIVQIKTKIR